MAAAEGAWQFQVVERGFLPPPADAGLHGSDDYDVLVSPTPYQAVCEAVAPATDRPSGWTTHLLIDPALPAFALPLVVSHEFHHGIQAGICAFGNNLSEAGALYVSGIHRKGEGKNLSYFLGFNAFQHAPDRSLDWQGNTGDFYPYGSALYFMYLDDVDATAPLTRYKSLLDELYARTKSAPSAACPYYLDAVDTLVGLDASYGRFARWRYFVGEQDDGQHFSDLANWKGAKATDVLEPVALDRETDLAELPLAAAQPATLPMPYGASYVRVGLADAAPGTRLRLGFQGDAATRWRIESILQRPGEGSLEGELEVGADGQKTADLSLAVVIAWCSRS